MIYLVQFPLQKNGTIFLTFRTIFLPANPPETGLQSFEKSRPPKFWIPAQIQVNPKFWYRRKSGEMATFVGEKQRPLSCKGKNIWWNFTKKVVFHLFHGIWGSVPFLHKKGAYDRIRINILPPPPPPIFSCISLPLNRFLSTKSGPSITDRTSAPG